MNIESVLANEFSLNALQVQNTVALIDEGNTIPFIARYRKEQTGSMDDQTLRELFERLTYLRGLHERKEQVLKLLTEQGNLTDEISAQLENAATLTAVEDIYRPFRPKRRTRATIAIEKGLQPLADAIWAQELNCAVEEEAAAYIDVEKQVNTAQEAIEGACDILAERISDDPAFRAAVRDLTWQEGVICSVLSSAAKENEESSEDINPQHADRAGVYDMYAEFRESARKIAGHRILALNRGENEKQLKVSVEAPIEAIIAKLTQRIVKNNPFTNALMANTITDSYKRLIAPSIERELRSELTEEAEEGAIKVFAENLRQLLMQAPIKDKIVLAIDPGFRTGCKWAVVDVTGKVLETGVVFCTIGSNTSAAKKTIKTAIIKHNVDVIAIGNGTASRETEQVVSELLKEESLEAKYIIVNEAGASVYSASKLGASEFPDMDVALRSAVSIGRRLQDPLAELVKIDPKSIGVGQYQHDMNQKRLSETLRGVVEACVNAVGVDLNTASPSLLSYISGISPATATHILEYREANGTFKSRRELLKVKKLGPKAFEQCAGFLRIPGAKNPLDNTGVHPESYAVAEQWLKIDEPMTLEDAAKKLSVGLPTLKDIVLELEKPGRDLRDDFAPPMLRSDVLSMSDLYEGLVLKGTIRNIVDFGAFVDIGVHQDGLVHISKMSETFIRHPLEAVSVGDIVDVTVLSIDLKRKRIALSMI